MSVIQHTAFQTAAAAFMLLAFAGAPDVSAHGDLQIRIAGMTRQIESATNKAELYLDRGELLREHLDLAGAEADYNKAAELDPGLARVDVCRALLLADRGDLSASRKMFDQAITRLPNSSEALIGRARLLIRMDDRPAAINDYQRGIAAIRMPDPAWFRELAEAFLAEGKTNEAIAALDAGVAKMPVPSLQQFAFDIELNRKNFESALTRLNRIIEESGRKETLLTQRAEVLLMAGRPQEAQASLAAAVEAIKLLPERIQLGPPIQQLKIRIAETSRQAETIASAAAKTR